MNKLLKQIITWVSIIAVIGACVAVTVLLAGEPVAADNGTNGTDGQNGLSAYEIAVANGFVGTEQEWLAGLQGADGQDGSVANMTPHTFSTLADLNSAFNDLTDAQKITLKIRYVGVNMLVGVRYVWIDYSTGEITHASTNTVALISNLYFNLSNFTSANSFTVSSIYKNATVSFTFSNTYLTCDYNLAGNYNGNVGISYNASQPTYITLSASPLSESAYQTCYLDDWEFWY